LRGKNRHVLPMCGIFVGAAVVSELNATRVKASRVGDRGLRSESEGRKRACRRTGRVDVEDYLVLVLGMKGNVKPPLSVQGCRFLLTRDVREKISEDLTAKMSHLFAEALIRVTWRLDVWSRFPFLERFADVSSQDMYCSGVADSLQLRKATCFQDSLSSRSHSAGCEGLVPPGFEGKLEPFDRSKLP
jgi:hypothetical protein